MKELKRPIASTILTGNKKKNRFAGRVDDSYLRGRLKHTIIMRVVSSSFKISSLEIG